MKNKALILLFFILFKGCKQTNKNEEIYISNSENFELSPFTNIILKENITEYNLILNINNINWSKYHNKRDALILGVDEYKLNTALSFTKEKKSKEHYYYPISNDFDPKSFPKEINSILTKDVKLKFYTKIYKTKTTPIIVIDSVRLHKE
tara:strand:+ start:316 stop:765 length:450 start_codon:yes stop_codon:yes gene_type:complete